MSPAPSDTNTADIPSAPLPRMQPAHAPNFLPSSSSAFLAGLGLGGLGVAATKAGLGVQRLAAAQLIKRREKKAKAAEERTQTAAVLRAREALSSGPKPQNCRRLVVLGAPRVGKTAILRRFLRDGFNEQYEPTREDFHRKVYSIRGETYQIDILDAAGERDFPAKRRLSILTGDIFLLVFSVDDRISFEEVCALRSEISSAKAALTRSKAHAISAPVVVCANKVDLPVEQHAVSRTEALHVFTDGCAFYETSAKDSNNLEEVFVALAERGGLPLETGPSRHRKLSIRSYHAILRARQRGGDTPCGAVNPLARRPSFGTDLQLALSSREEQTQSMKLSKAVTHPACPIQ
ncbi:GTP-binding protein Rhes [Tachysurus vachellii]|uniref:GTP-binding protein Rhes n=1 Tax=Tachysurus vachellii TaxID=175792 RepID=UPI00296AFC0E|nr:GTP-binding protein Rhes [Tachysurus vachellii]